MAKKIYYSCYVTSNGTENAEPYEDTNKAKAIKDIKSIARAHLISNREWARVKVWYRDENDEIVYIYRADVRINGITMLDENM